MAQVNGIALAGLAAGGLFLYSGLKGKKVTKTVQSVIQGQNPGNVPVDNPIIGQIGGSGATAGNTASAGGGAAAAASAASSAPAGDKTGSPAANKALGRLMAAAYGWAGPGEWPYLESGWQEESGWSQYAANVPSDPYDHAYGIPQANPGTKMASAGADWKTSPATQIRWGLGYIKATYGRPSQVPGWSPDGPTAGYVGY